MSKVPIDYEFGDSVIVVLRTTVHGVVDNGEDGIDVITDDGTFNSLDKHLVAVWPDPEDD